MHLRHKHLCAIVHGLLDERLYTIGNDSALLGRNVLQGAHFVDKHPESTYPDSATLRTCTRGRHQL